MNNTQPEVSLYIAKRISKNGKPYTCLVLEAGDYRTQIFPSPIEARYLENDVKLQVVDDTEVKE